MKEMECDECGRIERYNAETKNSELKWCARCVLDVCEGDFIKEKTLIAEKEAEHRMKQRRRR